MSSNQFKHHDKICKVCKKIPIGTLWKCAECVDFDLCSSCHDQLDNRHGHRFWRNPTMLFLYKRILQNFDKAKHPVTCDECRRFPIVGIRWRCFQCVDFDLCSECYHDGKHDTPGHEFCCTTSTNERSPADKKRVRHEGVRCYNCRISPIIGTRWKCSQCADFDLCPWCYNLDQHQHRHNFWRIESPKYLTLIIENDLQTRHAVICCVCNRNPILGIRWNCKECTDFNLCSKCYHNNKHSFDKFGHRFWCIITSNFSNSNVSQTLMRSNLSLLECELGPSRNVMIGDSASSANNDSPTTMETTTNRRENIANTGDDYRNELQSNRNALQSNADSDQIQSSNSIDRIASQSTDTNLIGVRSSQNIVVRDSEPLFANNDTPILATTLRHAIRQSHIADHDSDQIESTNSNNFNASQASNDTNLICVGTRVVIELGFDTVLSIQQESGCDWSAVTLMDCMEHVGTVTQIKENGNVLVRYEHTGQQWLFNPVVLTRLADQSGASENIVVPDSEALLANNDTPIATTSRPTIRQSHIADHDSDQIESTNSNNRNASQASIDTNLICVGSRVKIELDLETLELFQRALGCVLSRESLMDCMEHVGTVTQIKENGNVLVRYEHSGRQWPFNPVVLTRLADQSGASENIVVPDSEALLANNDTPIATTSRRAIRQSHIADHDSDQIESTNSNNFNASQASVDTNLICVGSRVKIELDLETVQLLQQAWGCDWSYESLKDYMEGIGTVTLINENGNAVVRYAHIERSLICNPVVLTMFVDQSEPSENIVVYNLEALFADNVSLPSTESERNHIANIDENEHNRIVSAKNSEVAQYKVQLAEVQQELERMKDEATCPVCIEVRKNIIFQCGHGVCNECNDRLQGTTCPICRKQIQQRIPFY